MHTNFSTYQPEDETNKFLAKEYGVGFLQSEEGVDWYEAQKTMRPDTWKLMICPETGAILSYTQDASKLYPVGFSIVEVKKLPEDMSDAKKWMYKLGKVVPYVPSSEEKQAKLETDRKDLLKEAAEILQPLQFAKDLGIETEAEAELATKIKTYMVQVNRVSVDEDWPQKPF